jgi:hypothetical protein
VPSSIPSGFRFHQAPESAPIPLRVPPRLASWDAAGSSSQVRLAAFLEHAESQLAAWPVAREPLAVRLDVAVPADADLFESGDLDNYLFPLAQRLGSDRIASMWATKSHATRESTLRVARAHVVAGPAGEDWSVACVRATGSATLASWKESVRDQVAARAGAAPEGALEMEIAFRVGRGRSWINLWKQAIDSLGPVLGLVNARQPFHPRDGRIVCLALHHSLATELGHDVEIAFCWRPAGSRAGTRTAR